MHSTEIHLSIFKPGTRRPQAGACVCVCVFVCLHVCLPPRLLITCGMMCCDIDPYDWLNKFYGLYMAAVVGIISGHDISIHMRHGD